MYTQYNILKLGVLSLKLITLVKVPKIHNSYLSHYNSHVQV